MTSASGNLGPWEHLQVGKPGILRERLSTSLMSLQIARTFL